MDPLLLSDSIKDNNLIDEIKDLKERISILEHYPNDPDIPVAVFLNVQDYGATGDGTTDDGTAIQAAFDAISDESAIVFPVGIYYITSSISITGKDHIWIYGPGKIKVSGAFAAFDIDDTASRSTEFICFKDLFIVGNGSTSIGIELNKTNSAGVSDIRIINCEINACLKAVHTSSGGGPQRVWVEGCRLTATDIAGSIGVHLEAPDSKVVNNTIRGFDDGIILDSPSQLVRGNHIYMSPSSTHNTDISIRRDKSAASTGYLIVGNYLDGDPDDAAIVIDSQSARGITITGNYFHTEYDGGPFIAFEHTAGGSYNVQELTVIGNIFYGVNGTKTNGITFANSLTNGSKSFHIENNVWRTATVYSTSENDRQIGTHAASFTPNPMLGRIIEITITGNIAIGLPANANHGGIGNRITFLFIQDGTGSRDVSWHANYKQGWSDAGSAADARSTITFEWDGTNWNQVGAQSPYI